ncbi:MAG: carbamoyltransferase HypF, partial [Longimicrobiales bacterium]|nr:carbamoyltransferase HypF [Longimicrobiales bacterium]
RLALELGLTGWVRNEAGSVRILAQGAKGSLDRFVSTLRDRPPPLARIDSIETREEAPGDWVDFRVAPSTLAADGRLPVSPDVAMCPACLIELQDPDNRRYRYPFITCTDCGPRFTVIFALPYDRVRTSMSVFSQCSECEAEYRDPKDRRYHSETNGCPRCGPRVWFESGGAARDDSADASPATPLAGDRGLAAAAALLRSGGILALRGLGGFHLAVDATDEKAVGRLRERKGRAEKPLAVMVRELGEARMLGKVGLEEERLLTSPERPIVLLSKMPGSPLAPSVAPGLDRVGVMISYTPLHHLLMEETGTPLVMTSGNLSEEPIATGNQEAMERLGGMADGFLLHDREIVAPLDDSVTQVVEDTVLFHRRARGYAPLPLLLPVPSPEPLLGVGPHLKNTFSLAHQDTVYLSQHIGDLDSLETLRHFQESLRRFQALFHIEPEVVVRDLHPGYLSTRLAEEIAEALGSKEVMAVQHHHAHVAAVLAEHGEAGPVVGLAFDGTGYGDDGRVWGAEVLVSDLESYRRAGHLRYGPLPGGETAVRNPWRTVLGYLSLEPERERDFRLAFSGLSEDDRRVVARQAAAGINAPLASSMGRLFDAAAAVLGLRNRSGYEGQAAMELEAVAEKLDWQVGALNGGPEVGRARSPVVQLPFPVERDASGMFIMDPLPLLSALGKARQDGVSMALLATGFHRAVARTSADLAARLCEEKGLSTVVLCGGVFQNALLLGTVKGMVEEMGFRVLIPRLLSPNDGAISYGQVAVAAARLRTRKG